MTMTASDLAVGRHACSVACLTTLPSVRPSVCRTCRYRALLLLPVHTSQQTRSHCNYTSDTAITSQPISLPSASTRRDAKHRRRRGEWPITIAIAPQRVSPGKGVSPSRLGGLRSVTSSPSGVWGAAAPAKNDFSKRVRTPLIATFVEN